MWLGLDTFKLRPSRPEHSWARTELRSRRFTPGSLDIPLIWQKSDCSRSRGCSVAAIALPSLGCRVGNLLKDLTLIDILWKHAWHCTFTQKDKHDSCGSLCQHSVRKHTKCECESGDSSLGGRHCSYTPVN
jgi:hypothetical protein